MFQGQMAVDIVRSPLDQRRSSLRIQMAIPAEVICPDRGGRHQTALVRDISFSGAFFYCNLTPQVNSPISIDFHFPVVERRMKVTCHGTVVRVERSAPGSATGIAMQFQRHQVVLIH
ncbi:MAG TPA: PilZ domain-containing protein [Terriglobales bacterium]|nr:PilZ domain-containing protein [Terriglobales bacterium]